MIDFGRTIIPINTNNQVWTTVTITFSKKFVTVPYAFYTHYSTNVAQRAITVHSTTNIISMYIISN